MSSHLVDSRPQDIEPTTTLRSATSEANPPSTVHPTTEPVNNTHAEPANAVAPAQQDASVHTSRDVNRNINTVEPIPSVPPPAYLPPPECRGSRLYDFDDLSSTSHHDQDDDLERAQPPPPYTGPARQPTIILFSRQPGDAAIVSHYPTMDSYMKRSKRMKLYGAVTLAALIIIGIVLLGTLIARQQLGGDSDESDRLG
ncbi:hypothetical protein TWF694_007771 [Orbilia ellipsospora]|uniref:Uncharacterized protein n=1 Tax=Orbilia ellipsospora TaxID=2528407 RepID=A0AAV9XJ72_9PEZI